MRELKSIKYLFGSMEYQLLGKDLSILIRKYNNQDILDLSKYLSFGAEIHHKEVLCRESKRETIEEISSFISHLGTDEYNHPYHEYARRVCETLDELLMNAIFHANPRLAGSQRDIEYTLKDREVVGVSWGFDGEYFGLSVRDFFGCVKRETLLSYLDSSKPFQDVTQTKSGGLGVKTIFDRTHQLVANINEGQVTEIICLMKFESRLRDFESHKNSFFYFEKSR